MRPKPVLSPRLTFATAALLMVAAACSKHHHHPVAPEPPAVQLGTPLTPAAAVFPGGPLLWSAQTDEVVYASTDGPLVATHSSSGASRILDPMNCMASAMAHDGSAVYYSATTDSDSLFARRIALSLGAVPRTLDSCAAFCLHFIEPAPDGDQVAIATLSFDSLLIHRLTTGGQKAVTIGMPIVFSPASTQLLINDLLAPLTEARIVAIATGATEPAAIGTPEGIGVGKVRWTIDGLEVLYVAEDRRSLFLRRVGPATTTLIWTSPDTLEAGSMAWSESGDWAAIWSSHRVASTVSDFARHYDLHAVDLPARTARIIAAADGVGAPLPLLRSRFRVQRPTAAIVATSAGNAVISADETKVAYEFERRIYRSAFSTPAASATQR